LRKFFKDDTITKELFQDIKEIQNENGKIRFEKFSNYIAVPLAIEMEKNSSKKCMDEVKSAKDISFQL
jgi:hypothetical protein